MNTKEALDLYELTDEKNLGYPGVYVIGSLSAGERIAVSSQQVRALNLVHSLFAEKRLTSGTRVCVVGGGAAGLTAAAYAITREAVVTVIESHDLLWNLRGCRTRWLHPNLFRWWPNSKWKRTGTDFPVMNWYAGYANDIGELLLQKYLSFEALQASRSSSKHLRYPGHQNARDVVVDSVGSEWNVTWVPLSDNDGKEVPRCDVFDVVVIATGFGSEARTRDTEASLYWLDDTLERERPTGRQMRYLISGTGDGGLTDLLRVRVKGFRHHHLRDCLLDIDPFASEIEARLAEVEEKVRSDKGFNLTAAYVEIARDHALGGLLAARRGATSVVLTNRESGGALASPAWRVSKFLAAQLLAQDPLTEYRPGPAQWTPVLSPTIGTGQPSPHPEKFHVQFAKGSPSGEFDAVVVRHGPQKLVHQKWGNNPVAAPLVTLTSMGFERSSIEAARNKWETLARSGQPTDELVDEQGMRTNFETRLRSRIHTVLPAVGGRTVIGMLSRLVSSVCPEEQEAPTWDLVDIDDPLVTDDVAALLTEVGQRLAHGRNAGLPGNLRSEEDRGWRLGTEIDRKEAIEVIWAADRYLKSLWDQRQDTELLERSWVLPRTPWSTRAPLLQHTCVARHWGPYRLRYLRDERPPAKNRPRSRHKLERLLEARLESIGVPAASSAGNVLAIVDCSDLEMRLAVALEGVPRVWRLARELSADQLYIQSLGVWHPLRT